MKKNVFIIKSVIYLIFFPQKQLQKETEKC